VLQEQNGCGRTASSTKFRLLSETRTTSTPESGDPREPEGLRGEPSRRVGRFIEDDLAGRVPATGSS